MALGFPALLGLLFPVLGAPITAEQFAAKVTEKSCEDLGDALIDALGSPDADLGSRAESVVARCGKRVTKDLVRGLQNPEAAPRLIPLLARVAPEVAREKLPALLGKGDGKSRAIVRSSLAHALDRAPEPRAAWTAFASAPAAANLDAAVAQGRDANSEATRVLLGHLGDAGPAGKTRLFAALDAGDAAAKYTLSPGLAELAQTGDGEAAERLDALLRGAKEPWVRARAASLCAAKCEHLVAAAGDENPRVRAAALTSLGQNAGSPSLPAAALAKLATDDPFPFVQAAAVELLAAAPPSDDADNALVTATHARAPRVRSAAAHTLGTRLTPTAKSWKDGTKRLREIVGDDNEDGGVRAAAATALGATCDREAIGVLRRVSIDGALPLATETIAEASLAAAIALGRYADEGGRKDLAALKNPNVRADLRQAAGMGLAAKPVCGNGR